jgi:hypothetical protein
MTKRYLGNIIVENPTAPVPTARPSTIGSAKGVWSLNEALTYQKAGQWPYPVFAPDAPVIGTATAGSSSATVSFSAPSDDGGLDITQYTATSSPSSITGTASSSPITVTGLSNGTSYTFTVTATNAVGVGPASSSSNSASPVAPVYAMIAGGAKVGGPGRLRDIQRFSMSSLGNASDFGDLTQDLRFLGACGNATRTLFAGGDASSGATTNIDYVSPISGGQAANFGTMTYTMERNTALANSTRGIIVSGRVGGNNWGDINYVTIASTGNASNFNTIQRSSLTGFADNAACASTTRGVFGGGQNASSVETSNIYYVTIATTGERTSFGNLVEGNQELCATSSSTRGLFCGGKSSDTTIQYVTIASTGNTTDFGDLTQERGKSAAASSSSTRATIAGGKEYFASSNTIDYVTIASTGNAADFGDLIYPLWSTAGTSNGHGGL